MDLIAQAIHRNSHPRPMCLVCNEREAIDNDHPTFAGELLGKFCEKCARDVFAAGSEWFTFNDERDKAWEAIRTLRKFIGKYNPDDWSHRRQAKYPFQVAWLKSDTYLVDNVTQADATLTTLNHLIMDIVRFFPSPHTFRDHLVELSKNPEPKD